MVKPPTAKTVMKMGMSSFSFPQTSCPALQKAVIIPVCINQLKGAADDENKEDDLVYAGAAQSSHKAMGISSGETGDDST